jgi:hypothetical protein
VPDEANATASMVGCISLYHVGEWALLHVIRHNKQMKRLLVS